jgi:hypothetical protein
MKVFKYIISDFGITSISMPIDSIILSCQRQNNNIVLWVLADEFKPHKKKLFEAVMTGRPVDPNNIIKHIATIQLDEGSFVTHIFEIYK